MKNEKSQRRTGRHVWNIADLPEHLRKQAEDQIAQCPSRLALLPMSTPALRSKYGAVKTEIAGEKFDSKKEAKICRELRLAHGEKNVIRQVSIPIGARRIRPDFMIIIERLDGGRMVVEFQDAKGMVTKDWATKAAWLLDKHGIKITTL